MLTGGGTARKVYEARSAKSDSLNVPQWKKELGTGVEYLWSSWQDLRIAWPAREVQDTRHYQAV